MVIEIHAWSGERPGDAGVLTIGDINAMGVEVEVYQAAIGAVAVGAAVTIDADALPRPLNGPVARIGLQVGSPLPRQRMFEAPATPGVGRGSRPWSAAANECRSPRC